MSIGLWTGSLSQRITFKKSKSGTKALMFSTSPPRTIGVHKVSIPDYYFKAFLINHAGCYHAVAFLCPNNSNVVTIDSVVCSVNVVESASGLDLFEFLDDCIEESIESRFDLDMFLKTNK